MKPFVAPALLALLAPWAALAQDAPQKFDIAFTWSGHDAEVQDAGPGWKLAVGSSDLVFTGTEGTPFDKLVGRCLMLTFFKTDAEEYRASGGCLFVDAEGGRLYETFTEANGKGKGVMKDGTGALAGLVAEYDYEGTWLGSPGPDRNAGTGRKVGTWRRTGS